MLLCGDDFDEGTANQAGVFAGPPPIWLVGNLLDVLRMSFPKAAQHWRKRYGPVFKVTFSPWR